MKIHRYQCSVLMDSSSMSVNILNASKDYLVLLDEINRCNIPSVFGDLLTAIERSKRAVWKS